MKLPENLRYTRDHEWVRQEENGTLSVGITDFAQGELGDIVFVELEDVGSEFDQDSIFGTVEAVKTVSELFMPVSGTILAINEELEASPELVNEDPYGRGWMVRIEMADSSQLDQLMSAEEYAAMVS
ncbi:MAG: glycine cleavage system protein GcvH [Bacteroidota bacterium]